MEKGTVQTIGIMGAGPGCGVTHLSLLLANYLAAVEWKRTAVLERGARPVFGELIRACTGREWVSGSVSIMGVDYFPESGAEELAGCLQRGYECILLDFGCVREDGKAEFLQCTRKLFLAALNEWKLKSLLVQRNWMLTGKGDWEFLSVFGGEEAKREVRRRLGLRFVPIPYVPDVFSIDRDTAVFFGRIWREKGWEDEKR